ncbi:ionotropic receptor 21a [Colias croceus]|uniref:ionotropic receptor 21a n=1 Tax=Colias crocea TaxID=72248 RepID=UPI001E27F070|nr:ionotropic receptor 21a [Colias croceus]
MFDRQYLYQRITMQLLYLFLLYIHIVECKEIIEYYPSMRELSRGGLVERHYKNNVNHKMKQQIQRPHRIFNEKEERIYKNITKRASDPVFHGYPKTVEELWHERFLKLDGAFDQTPSLIHLIQNITLTYLNDCTPVLLYDSQIKSANTYLFQNLFKTFPVSFVHGYIGSNDSLQEPKLLHPNQECLHFILFLNDVKRSAKIIGKQPKSKVVVVANASQWAVQEFLSGPQSRVFIDLLVIGQSFKDDDNTLEAPYILYTHNLYTDGLGSSEPRILVSWTHGKFSRNVNLFPTKMTEGYSGHRFLIAAANQPPFVFKRSTLNTKSGDSQTTWDGVEIRILKLLAERNNFSIEIVEPRDSNLGSGDAVAKEIAQGKADIGVAGLYVTSERMRDMDLSFRHSQDCAVFVTLTSTALPRYRAILGPFHWHIWVALTFTYLIGIFPLAFSDKHTLRHLINNSGEVENMFWYVFGTFTNCFTFVGKNSWSKTTKITTRLLIGWYWLFTIIITSCYTGCIIAFVTLPIYPETVDTIQQLLSGFYRVGTLDRGGWERWFVNTSDPMTNKLLKKVELVPDIRTGIRNITKAFFWPYAFLGSKAELEYLIQSNFSKAESKRAVLHISNECFVPFGVTIGFPNNSIHTTKLSNDIRKLLQAGIIDKITDDVRWEIQRSSTGKLLSVKSTSLSSNSLEEKGLTLEDTQGMFLLLGAGFLIAATALISEWMGGFTRRCRSIRPHSTESKEDLINTGYPEDSLKEVDRLQINSRSTSIESSDTLDSQILQINQESIVVHNNVDDSIWNSRQSSIDLDKEVQNIFMKDEKPIRTEKRKIEMTKSKSLEKSRQDTASKVFGDHVTE